MKHCFVFMAEKCESKVNAKTSVKKYSVCGLFFSGDRLSCLLMFVFREIKISPKKKEK